MGNPEGNSRVEVRSPECEKMAGARAEGSQTIGAFLDWLQNERKPPIVLAEYSNINEYDDDGAIMGDMLLPVRQRIEELLAEYFGVDLKKVEEERRQILDDLHQLHKDDKKRENQEELQQDIRTGRLGLEVG